LVLPPLAPVRVWSLRSSVAESGDRFESGVDQIEQATQAANFPAIAPPVPTARRELAAEQPSWDGADGSDACPGSFSGALLFRSLQEAMADEKTSQVWPVLLA
jgi:hypothetical protein